MSGTDQHSESGTKDDPKTPGAPGVVVVAEDPAAPSKHVSSKRQSVSDLFTIVSELAWYHKSRVRCFRSESRKC